MSIPRSIYDFVSLWRFLSDLKVLLYNIYAYAHWFFANLLSFFYFSFFATNHLLYLSFYEFLMKFWKCSQQVRSCSLRWATTLVVVCTREIESSSYYHLANNNTSRSEISLCFLILNIIPIVSVLFIFSISALDHYKRYT